MKPPILSLIFFLSFFVLFVEGGLQNTCSPYFQKSFVYYANYYRRVHSTFTDLQLVDDPRNELVYYAQLKAQFLAGNSKYDPLPPRIPFLVIPKIFRPDQGAQEVVGEMYHTGTGYPYYCREPPDGERQRYGRFTQLIWRSTQLITFGCDDNRQTGERHSAIVFWDEPGNVAGKYAYNVWPPNGRPCNLWPWGYQGEAAAGSNETEAETAVDAENWIVKKICFKF